MIPTEMATITSSPSQISRASPVIYDLKIKWAGGPTTRLMVGVNSSEIRAWHALYCVRRADTSSTAR